MSAYLPLEVQRNGVWVRSLTFTDTDGEPLDLTGATFLLRIRYAAGVQGPALASASFEVADPGQGVVNVTIDGMALNAVPGAMEPVELAYDLIVTQGGLRMPMLRGPLILLPGVS